MNADQRRGNRHVHFTPNSGHEMAIRGDIG
jgi:hypothetical protein